MTTPNQHWNAIFSTKTDPELGWYERDAAQTLKFLDLIPDNDNATIFLPGAGTSVLIDELLSRGAHLILNDVSDEALKKLKKRIGDRQERVIWLHHDISKPMPTDLPLADIWIDRAVLHFLLDEAQIEGYLRNLRAILRQGGFVLLAEFSTVGAPKCAGLDLHRYSVAELTKRLGEGFDLIKYEDYVFINPFDEPRPYVYALYKRT
ncbi:MAG TPA: class I SAM-dependent methyltransferase [Nitrospira sp.]